MKRFITIIPLALSLYCCGFKTVIVTVNNNFYSPKFININPGDTIKFQWIAGNHPTRSDDGTTIPVFQMNSGNTVKKVILNKEQVIPFYCTAHGGPGGTGMSGIIYVSENIATWNFEDADSIIDQTSDINLHNSIHTIGTNSSLSYPAGGADNSGLSISSSKWDNGLNSKYWETLISTSHYKDIYISSKQKSSDTGPTGFKVQYKIGSNGVYTDWGSPIVVKNDAFISGIFNATKLPVAAEKKDSVFIRWIMTSNTSANGSTVGSTGTSRIDNIFISGTSTLIKPKISFSNTSLSVNENADSIEVSLKVSEPDTDATTVQVFLVGGTANSINDFSFSSPRNITCPGNSTSQKFSIPIINDKETEGDETILLRLRNANNNGIIQADSNLSITINTNDQPAEIKFKSSQILVQEDVGLVSIPVSFHQQNTDGDSVSVEIEINSNSTAKQDSDFKFLNTRRIVANPNRDTSILFPVNIINDKFSEGRESIYLHLTRPSSNAIILSDSIYLVYIDSNDVPATVHFLNSGRTVNETNGITYASIAVQQKRSNGDSVLFGLHVTGTASIDSDYVITKNIIFSIPPDSSTIINFPIQINNDTLIENLESILFDIVPISKNNIITDSLSHFSLFIRSDDPVDSTHPVLYFAEPSGIKSCYEIHSSDSVMVHILYPSHFPTTVKINILDSTATENADYIISTQQIIFPERSQQSKPVYLNLINDLQVENDEYFYIVLSDPDNGAIFDPTENGKLLIKIISDDAPIGIRRSAQNSFHLFYNVSLKKIILKNPEAIKRIRIIDLSGRVQKEMIISGTLNTIAADALVPGIYIVESQTEQGNYFNKLFID